MLFQPALLTLQVAGRSPKRPCVFTPEVTHVTSNLKISSCGPMYAAGSDVAGTMVRKKTSATIARTMRKRANLAANRIIASELHVDEG